jgi:hypothetical protein
MSKVISVLEKMASDAAMNSEAAIAELVSTSDINDGQQQAIIAKDADQLAENTHDLPKIRAFVPIVPAEDDEPEESDKTNDNKDIDNSLATVANY